jgi:hypothetical protein
MKKFWMIIGENSGSTQMRHYSRVSAEKELKRLCQQNLGARFILLEAVSASVSELPPVETEAITEECTPEEAGKKETTISLSKGWPICKSQK